MDGYFRNLKNRGFFTGSAVDTNLIQLCFSMLVQVLKQSNKKNAFLINKKDIVASHANVCISFHHLDGGMKCKHYP